MADGEGKNPRANKGERWMSESQTVQDSIARRRVRTEGRDRKNQERIGVKNDQPIEGILPKYKRNLYALSGAR